MRALLGLFLLLSGHACRGGTITSGEVFIGGLPFLNFSGISNEGQPVSENLSLPQTSTPCIPMCPGNLFHFHQLENDVLGSPGAFFFLDIDGQIPPESGGDPGTQAVFSFPFTWSLDLTMYAGNPSLGAFPILYTLTDSGNGEGHAFGSYFYANGLGPPVVFFNDHITFDLTAVPEPASLILAGLAGVLLWLFAFLSPLRRARFFGL